MDEYEPDYDPIEPSETIHDMVGDIILVAFLIFLGLSIGWTMGIGTKFAAVTYYKLENAEWADVSVHEEGERPRICINTSKGWISGRPVGDEEAMVSVTGDTSEARVLIRGLYFRMPWDGETAAIEFPE